MGIRKLVFTIFCCLLFTTFLISQTKNEREERIKFNSFPKAAQIIVKQLPEDCKKLKFFKETDNERESFEAKFKYKKRRYSLEFSKTGQPEDIEVTVKFKSIKKKTKAAIRAYFDNEFLKTKIFKTQRQYALSHLENPSKVIETILDKTTHIAPNYEIIAEVKTKSDRTIREFTFNNLGELMLVRALAPESYEHILF